jgi:hypothetical protein
MAQRALPIVAPATHKRLGLLEGWSFFRLPQTAGLVCFCQRPAAYAAAPDGGMAMCVRHARNF